MIIQLDNSFQAKYQHAFLQQGAFVEHGVRVDSGASIGIGSVISGETHIASNAQILPYCVLHSCTIGQNAIIGPFAHMRAETVVEQGGKVGAFVETKKSHIGLNSKVPHLAYVGDATIGSNCNIGCGVVFCNYDGEHKHASVVGNNCFIGSNCNIVAPINIGSNCYTAAGSTLSKHLPDATFAKERAELITKPNKKAKPC